MGDGDGGDVIFDADAGMVVSLSGLLHCDMIRKSLLENMCCQS